MNIKLKLSMFKYSNNYNWTQTWLFDSWYLDICAILNYYYYSIIYFIHIYKSENYWYINYSNIWMRWSLSNSPERLIFRENSNFTLQFAFVFYEYNVCIRSVSTRFWKSVRFSPIFSIKMSLLTCKSINIV